MEKAPVKVLVIYGADGSIRSVPLANKPVLMAENNTMPADKKSRFEEMDEEAAAKLPAIDPDYKTPAERQKESQELASKLEQSQAESAGKDKLIAEMEAKLKELQKAQTVKTPAPPVA